MDTDIRAERRGSSRAAGSQSQRAPAGRPGRVRFAFLVTLVALVAWSYLAFRQDQLNRALLTASQDTDAAAVHRALNAGADPNIRLDYASQEREGLVDRLRSLFSRGRSSEPESIPTDHRTLLMDAVFHRDDRIAADLLAHGANPNLVVANGMTALTFAINLRCSEIVQALLTRGADVHVQSRAGLTPLLYAARAGTPDILQALLDHGADIHETDRRNWTPLLLAAESGQDDNVKVLLARGADLRELERTKMPPLLFAAAHGSAALIRALWVRGIDAATRDRLGPTALALAIRSQDRPSVSGGPGARYGGVLVQSWTAGVPAGGVVAGRVSGGGPFRTTFATSPPAVRALLDAGGPVEGPPGAAQQPLIVAAKYGQMGTVRLLLARGANVNVRDARGVTPLLAAYDLRSLRLLIARGADVHVRDLNGTLLMHAVDTPDLVMLLLRRGVDPNARDQYGRTPLMATSSPQVVRLLLTHGADVNARDKNGQTALMTAVQSAAVDKTRLLLEHGADVNARDRAGSTALAWANRIANAPLIHRLQEAGAKR